MSVYILIPFESAVSANTALDRDIPYIGHVITVEQSPALREIHLAAIARAMEGSKC